MALLDDVLGPSAAMLGPQGVQGTASVQNQPQPKKKTQQTPQTPIVAKTAQDPLDEQLARVGTSAPSSDPLDAQLARVGNPSGPDAKVQALHAAYQSGHLAQQERAKSIVDPERFSADQTGSPLDAALSSATQGGETALSGIPGGAMALAGLRHLSTGESYHDAQAEQAGEIRQYEKDHPVASKVMQALTAAPLAMRLPGNVVQGGALFGGAQQALAPDLDESFLQRVKNTAVGAGTGAVIGKLLGTAGNDVAGVGARTGATDALSDVLARANSPVADLGNAFGTRGTVNQAAADRLALQDAAGGTEAPATRLARTVAEGRAKAKPLYEGAEQQAQEIEQRPAESPVAAPFGVPVMAPDPAVQAANEATATALANPHVQMQLKSLLSDAPSLKGADPGSYPVLRQLQANMNAEYGKLKNAGQDSGPYWHELNGARADVNAALLAKAPSLAEANQTFAQQVGIPREGITKGQTAGITPVGKAAFKRSPDAIAQWIDAGQTPADQAARAEAVSSGVGAQIGQQIRRVPLEEGTQGVLDLPSLQSSEAGANFRALLDPAKRQALESTLAAMDEASARQQAAMTPRGKLSTLFNGPSQYDYLNAPAARGPIRQMNNLMADGRYDPAAFMRGLSMRGALRDAIRSVGVGLAGNTDRP